MESQDISPAVYHMLQSSRPTSASVERSLSMFILFIYLFIFQEMALQ